jgi:hypothetical protein
MIRASGRLAGVAQTVSAIGQIPSLLEQGAIKAMTQGLELLSSTIRQEFLVGPYPAEIQSRSGGFRATFVRGHRENIFKVESRGTQILGTFGSNDVRAQVLDEGTGSLPGGVIRPVRSKYLYIPVSFAKTASGATKRAYLQPRAIPNTFVRPNPRGGFFLFQRMRQKVIELIGLLKSSVKITGRHFMQKGLNRSLPGIEQGFRTMVTTIVDRANQTLSRLRG